MAETWTGETLLEYAAGHALDPRIVSDGTGYALAWRQDDGIHDSVYMSKFEGGSWTGAAPLEMAGGDARELVITTGGADYSAIWSQFDLVDPIVTDIRARCGW